MKLFSLLQILRGVKYTIERYLFTQFWEKVFYDKFSLKTNYIIGTEIQYTVIAHIKTPPIPYNFIVVQSLAM